MKSIIVVSHPQNAGRVIRWGARFAKARSDDSLTVLCCGLNGVKQPPALMRKDTHPNESALVRKVREAVDSIQGMAITMLVMQHPKPSKTIIDLIENEDTYTFLMVGVDYTLGRNHPGNRIGRHLLNFSPCDMLFLDPGNRDMDCCRKILVPMGGRLESFALHTAIDCAKKWKSEIIPLETGVYFGSDSMQVAHRTILNRLKEEGIEPSSMIQPAATLSGNKWKDIVNRSRKNDLVLVGASADLVLDQIRKTETRMDGVQDDRTCIGLLRPKKIDIRKPWSQLTARLSNWLPTLKTGERIDLFERLNAGGRWNVDFIVMICLSTAIAALGLIQDSTAVVIGAMVVAPLMTPIIGAGLSLVQGNMIFFRDCLRTLLKGILAALAISIIIGLIIPLEELTPQLLARGAPTLLDLGVALLSGIAAAYALARPNLLGALAGVAIAAALVPPLATVGISIVHGNWAIAKGAAILFITNMVSIILGAAWIFKQLGIQGARQGIGLRLWVRRIIIVLILCSAFLIAPLGLSLNQQLRQGQTRPYTLPVSQKVYQAIAGRVLQENNVKLISASRFGVESETDVTILLTASKAVTDEFISDLKTVVNEAFEENVRVAVFAFKDVGVIQGQ
jgi:uncharacterized hydrophobic protein (TIGR00271 family)